jgi:peptide/nickel transport system substrate-binding protein
VGVGGEVAGAVVSARARPGAPDFECSIGDTLTHSTLAFARLLVSLGMAAFAAAMPSQAQELRIGLSANVTSMDPHFHNLAPNNNIAEHVFEKLTRFHEDGSVLQPGLATRWRAIDDRTWEFALRQDVKFHNGEEFTADDVIFSLERVPKVFNSPGPFTNFVRDIVGMEAPDKYTVRLKTAGPHPLIPHYMAAIYIVSRKAASGAGSDDFNTGKAAIGTGPFKLARFVRNEQVELLRNDGYWGAKPPWATVVFRIITNDASRIASLLSGEVQAIENIATSDLQRVKQFGQVYSRTTNRLIYLVTDQDRDLSPGVSDRNGAPLPMNPLKDVRVRMALSKAIDRNAIVERVMVGQATAAGQLVPPGMLGHDPRLAPLAYDPSGARRLLAEAGYSEGFNLTLNGPNDRYVNDDAILQTVAAMWARIGINAKVEAQPMAVFFPRVRQRQTSAHLLGLAPSTSEASAYFRAMVATFDEKRGMGALNHGRYSNQQLNASLERALFQLLDTDELQRSLFEAASIAMREQAVIPLHWQVALWGTAKHLNYTPRADEYTLAHEFSAR